MREKLQIKLFPQLLICLLNLLNMEPSKFAISKLGLIDIYSEPVGEVECQHVSVRVLHLLFSQLLFSFYGFFCFSKACSDLFIRDRCTFLESRVIDTILHLSVILCMFVSFAYTFSVYACILIWFNPLPSSFFRQHRLQCVHHDPRNPIGVSFN